MHYNVFKLRAKLCSFNAILKIGSDLLLRILLRREFLNLIQLKEKERL